MSRGVSDDAMSGKVKAIDAVECARQLEEARRVLKEKEAALAAITDQTDRAASIPPNVDNVDTPIATTTAVSSSKTPSNVEVTNCVSQPVKKLVCYTLFLTTMSDGFFF